MGMILLGRYWQGRYVIAAGGSQSILLPSAGFISVCAEPGSGGTATVNFTVSGDEEFAANSSIWLPLINAVSAPTEANRLVPTRALQLSAATAAATFDILQWANP